MMDARIAGIKDKIQTFEHGKSAFIILISCFCTHEIQLLQNITRGVGRHKCKGKH